MHYHVLGTGKGGCVYMPYEGLDLVSQRAGSWR